MFISWSDEGSENYAGGLILLDSAGDVMRVSLGEGDVDCRPYYVADENDWIVKALVAVEDGEFWSHCGVRPLSVVLFASASFFVRIMLKRVKNFGGLSTVFNAARRLV